MNTKEEAEERKKWADNIQHWILLSFGAYKREWHRKLARFYGMYNCQMHLRLVTADN